MNLKQFLKKPLPLLVRCRGLVIKYQFYAILEKEDTYYNMHFPDLPGVLTFGNGIEKAIEMANDVLEEHLLVLEEDKDEIPQPSDLHELKMKLKENQQLQLITVNTQIICHKAKDS